MIRRRKSVQIKDAINRAKYIKKQFSISFHIFLLGCEYF